MSMPPPVNVVFVVVACCPSPSFWAPCIPAARMLETTAQVDLMLPAIVVPRHHHLRRTSIINLDHQMFLLSRCLVHRLSIKPLPHQNGGSRQGGWVWLVVGNCWQWRWWWQQWRQQRWWRWRQKAGGSSSTIIAKQRLEGLRPAITGDKKLYSKEDYDSNAEKEACK